MVAKGPGFQKRLNGYEGGDIKKGGRRHKKGREQHKGTEATTTTKALALNECDKNKLKKMKRSSLYHEQATWGPFNS